MSQPTISEPKAFQVRTAEAALAAFARDGGPRRFLIADEVGLGKTVVARTVVREMMKRRRTPLVVFYVASNLTIAHQNRRKLLEAVSDDPDAAALA
jgi:superfamily II DNA or RNA helicase